MGCASRHPKGFSRIVSRHGPPRAPLVARIHKMSLCKALPAEASLARACLKHGLAAASLTAHSTTWSQDDGQRAAHALVALSTRQGWKVPLYAIGIG